MGDSGAPRAKRTSKAFDWHDSLHSSSAAVVRSAADALDKYVFIVTSFQDGGVSIVVSALGKAGENLSIEQVNVLGPQGNLIASSNGQASSTKQVSFGVGRSQPYTIEVTGPGYSLRNLYLLSENVALSEPTIAWFNGLYLDRHLEFVSILERAYSKMVELRGAETSHGGITVNHAPWPAAWAGGEAAFVHGFMLEGETRPDFWEFILKNRIYLPGAVGWYEKTGYYMDARVVLDTYFHEMAHNLFEPLPGYLEEGFACFFEIETFLLLDYRNEYVTNYGLVEVLLFEQSVGNDYSKIATYMKGPAFPGAWIAAYVLHDFLGHEQWVVDAVKANLALTPRDLVQDFGWEFYKKYFALIATQQVPSGYTDDEIFAYYFGQASGQDLRGLFTSWGFNIPVRSLGYAIIVAGQGGLVEQRAIDHSANNAYKVLRNLGFDDDHIFYLNNRPQDVDGNGKNNVDTLASLGYFNNTMSEVKGKIGDSPAPFILFLTGHGVSGQFLFDQYETEGSSLHNYQLKEMLDEFTSKTRMLIFIDSCYSGSFIVSLNGISASNRIIITGAHDDQERLWIPWLRSSDRFWGNLNKGLNAKDAFIANTWPGEWWHLWLDDNGDSIGHPPNNLVDDGGLAASTQIGVPDTENLIMTPWQCVWKRSPGELRVYDSENRVTGVVNGEVKEEIPNSIYDEENEIVAIFSPFDTYRYEIAGTETGTYGLDIAFIEDGEATTFTATEIPTAFGTIYQYTIDWIALSQGEEGVTVQVDSDGDGVFERTFASDSELSQDEFMLAARKFYAVWENVGYPVFISSNSTVSHFAFIQPQKQISFNMTGLSGAKGYCNVTIPKSLLKGEPWTILVDNTPISFIQAENATHSFLYFTYTHGSTFQVIVQGIWVIPEFPSAIILVLFMSLSTMAILFGKKRLGPVQCRVRVCRLV